MRPISLLSLVSLSTLGCHGLSFGGKPGKLLRGGRGGSDGGGPSKRALLQNVVTWDQHSLLINGERIMLFCGEFHPFRLPVPSLWLDILQKIRALGLNCASFYVDWALLEGKRGNFTAEGVFAWDPFFEAALKAGVYLIAVRCQPRVRMRLSCLLTFRIASGAIHKCASKSGTIRGMAC